MKMNDGGAAFPQPVTGSGRPVDDEVGKGMTLRDYFATKAMQGAIAGIDRPKTDCIARLAYQMADSMLAEREKAQQP
jgi:hypothetical protein